MEGKHIFLYSYTEKGKQQTKSQREKTPMVIKQCSTVKEPEQKTHVKSLERRLVIAGFFYTYTLIRNNIFKIFNQLKLFAGSKVGTLYVYYSFSVEIIEWWKTIRDLGLKKKNRNTVEASNKLKRNKN